MRITVIGAGVIGLTCALRLAQAGHEVTVVTADEPADTTSTVAGGLIYPRHAEPADRCAEWTAASAVEFARLAEQRETGVRMMSGRLLRRVDRPVPDWADAVGGMQRSAAADPWHDELRFTPPLVNTGKYVAWLAATVTAAGVPVQRRTVTDLDAAAADADVLVNAAGIGGAALAGDGTVVPARGQVVHVADPGLTEWLVDEDGFSYVLPHGDHVVCGGTEEVGDGSVEPDVATTTDILRRCAVLVPQLADADVLRVKVGLRPFRPQIRLERVGDIVHCYGHGGVGITVSWGCADEVSTLVDG